MSNNFEIEELDLTNSQKYNELSEFLLRFDLKIDNIDYTIVFRDDNNIIATVSKYGNLIKCSAICEKYTGRNLLNTLITKMFYKINEEGYDCSFLITKISNKSKFEQIGLYKVYQNDNIIFFTNNYEKLKKYERYLFDISKKNDREKAAAVVVNANPLSKGHDYLINTAATQNELVYIIPVYEDVSFFTYKERVEMIRNSIKKYDNVYLLEGSEFLISKSTFPSYFLNQEKEIVEEQSKLDAGLFWQIYCKNLNIVNRYVGEEPFSRTTNIYNYVLEEFLKSKKIKLNIIKRLEVDGKPISASQIREAILNQDIELLKKYCLDTNIDFISSKEIYDRAINHKDKIYKKN
ncbi:hypothetical protein [Spiroplasma endosymbiont of Aspidapion aeneum]|uniref:hypothetical protein n=1 Tax=Spiroplasma endosymbiont of Aspidapion aeneum TaxID=3066276 RepID=UPI00313C8783